MDPSRNNMPLVFNANKHKPLIKNSDGMDHHDDVSSSSVHQNMMVMDGNAPEPGMFNNMGNMGNMMGNMNQMMGGMMQGMMQGMGDPNMMMMGNNMMMNNNMGMMGPDGSMMGAMGGPGGPMGNMGGPGGPMGNMGGPSLLGPGGQGMMGGPGPMGPGGPGMMGGPSMMGPGPQGSPMKEVIRTKNCVLYPPAPGNGNWGGPPRGTRDRPPGCKTIFVGGIPEKCTEELMAEVFESCGPIQSIRISKKNFSHIRFENMQSVDQAMYISGYRMKIGDSDEKEETGRLHVDYAQARDDQYDFECQQRALAREMRHIQSLQRMEEERKRPPSPPPIHHYSDHEGSQLLEKLKSEENFQAASQSLVSWLEKGECNRRTSNQFYAMVQKVHSQMLRINTERMTVDSEYEQYKIQYQQRLMAITGQISQVERVLQSAHKQKCWDHFTKAQRKSIDTWLRQAQDARKQSDAAANMKSNEDMEMSSEDDEPTPKKKSKHSAPSKQFNQGMEDENNSLKSQMEAFRNEVEILKHERDSEVVTKSKQITALQNALQGMQQQLITQRAAAAAASAKVAQDAAEAALVAESKQEAAEKENGKSSVSSAKTAAKEEVSSSGLNMSEKEAKMIGLISCFLHVHPNGATVDYLWSYLRQIVNVRTREVEDLLEKLPSMFSQEIHGVGAAIERRWVFLGLQRSTPASSLLA